MNALEGLRKRSTSHPLLAAACVVAATIASATAIVTVHASTASGERQTTRQPAASRAEAAAHRDMVLAQAAKVESPWIPADVPVATANNAPEPAAEPAPVPEQSGPSAPSPKYLNLIGTIPLPNDALRDRIVLFFDGELAALPAGEVPFRLTPARAGTFKVGSNFVAYDFAEPHDKHDRGFVTVELSPSLRSVGGERVNPGQARFKFSLSKVGPARIWTLRETPEQVVLGITFSTSVTVEDVRAHLAVRPVDATGTEGADIPYTLEAVWNDRNFSLTLTGNRQWPIHLVFKPGLPDAAGVNMLVEPSTWVYPPDTLRVQNVQWGTFTPDQQQILVHFTKAVSSEEVAQRLQITDSASGEALPVEINRSVDTAVRAVLRLANPAKIRVSLRIEKGLPGAERTVLKNTYTTELTREPKPLRMEHTWWGQENETGLVLHLNLSTEVGLEDLRGRLSVTPEVPDMQVSRPYGRHITVSGQWRSEQAYTLSLEPGLRYDDVGILDTAVTQMLMTPKVPPYLGFGHEGAFYFPRGRAANLPLLSRNVEEAQVDVFRMFPNNIAVALNAMRDGEGSWEFMGSWSKEIASRKIALAHDPDQLAETPLRLDEILPESQTGVFCLKATAERCGAGTKLVLATNIGALAHWQNDELVVFVHDLYSLAPLRLAKVSVYSDKNQLLGTVNTNAQGTAHLASFGDGLGTPRVIVVRHGADYTFLELAPREADGQVLTPDMPGYDRDGYDGFLYADRELYRPGETAHLRWLVRTDYGDAVPDVPLLLTVVKPNGRNLLSRPTTLSALGTGDVDLETQRDYPTGKYTAQLTVPGEKRPIGTYNFSLEEFVPNRIKAEVALPETRWLSGEAHTIEVTANHLFGGPAAKRRCEASVLLKRGGFAPEQWKAYRFDNDSRFEPDTVSCGELETDEQGKAAFTATYNAPSQVTFPLRAVAMGRVFELGGRAVAATAEATVFPSDTCLGIAAEPKPGSVEAFVAAIRPDESPADLAEVTVTLEERVWSYHVRRYYTHHESRWSEVYEPVESRQVALSGGEGSTQFSLENRWGSYRIRVHSDRTRQYSTLSFYAYGGQCHLCDASRPSLIAVSLDKKAYTVGDTAQIRIESPFDGQGIVVVQGEEIQRIIPVAIKDGLGTLSLPVGREHFPNVWIEATVVHAVEKEHRQVYPFSSFAMVPLPVIDPERALTVAYTDLPEEMRPDGPIQIAVDVRDATGGPVAAELTLAAVDEGIHTITGYESPDPSGWLRRLRQPVLRRAHYYDKVAYDFEPVEPGGDLDALLGKRAAAVDENWIKPVALWSGVVRTDASGRAVVTMDVPEFTGQLRLVAVACSDKALGAHSDHIFVRRPYMMRTSMPRFLLPGDRVRCRGVIFNHTEAACTAQVRWETGGALATTAGSKELAVTAQGEASFAVDIAAAAAVGQGTLRWETVILDAQGLEVERLEETAPIPVRPPAAYQSHHELAVLKPGESRTFTNTRFVDDQRASLEVNVSANPQLQLVDALKYVVRYPYGCVEQTTSRLLPMYLLRKSSGLADSVLEEKGKLDVYISAGIGRLFAMQTPSGGLGYWPGSQDPYPYGSVYALHFLTLVKNGREYQLPESGYAELVDYVRGVANDWSEDSKSALYRRAYAVYVLALGGDLKAIEQVERFDDIMLPRTARLLLAATLAQHTQDGDRVQLYLNEAPAEPYEVTERDGTLNSDIRNTAIELLALRKIGAPADVLLEKASALTAYVKGKRHGSTQETAFIVTALSDYLEGAAGTIDLAAATITGPEGPGALQGAEVFHGIHEGPGGTFTVANTGGADLFVSVTTCGVPERPNLAPVNEGLSIERRFYTATGEDHTGVFRQGHSYVVELKMDLANRTENIVAADLLPAGFEIENPRLDESTALLPDRRGMITPTYRDVRDDRLVMAFSQIPSGERYLRYVVRAVSPGRFQYPPVEAECMYDASIRGASGAGEVEVEE